MRSPTKSSLFPQGQPGEHVVGWRHFFCGRELTPTLENGDGFCLFWGDGDAKLIKGGSLFRKQRYIFHIGFIVLPMR